jgi:predicted DNA-binding protein
MLLSTKGVRGMVETLYTRISPKLKQRIEQDCKVRGIESQNEYVVQALQHFLECRKVKLSMSMKYIPLPCDCECVICHKKTGPPHWGFYMNGNVICRDCYVKRYGEKGTAKLALKEREGKYKLKVLKEGIEKMLQDYEEAEFVGSARETLEENKKINRENMEVNQLALQYLNENLGTKQEKEAFEKLMRKLEDLVRDREDFRTVLDHALERYRKLLMTRKKKRKKAGALVEA